jgi:hypothetical protein
MADIKIIEPVTSQIRVGLIASLSLVILAEIKPRESGYYTPTSYGVGYSFLIIRFLICVRELPKRNLTMKVTKVQEDSF